jgi:sec-independent protein translocase protein TatC
VATTEDDPINDKPMPLLEHLVELRTRLMWSMVAFAICFAVSYYFSDQIYYFLARPLAIVLRNTGNPDPKLIYTQLYEAFFTRIKIGVFGGAFLGFPIIAAQLWLFVAPGLYRSEKRALLPFLAATPVLFVAGGALAYFVFFPLAFTFFARFQSPLGGGGLLFQRFHLVAQRGRLGLQPGGIGTRPLALTDLAGQCVAPCLPLLQGGLRNAAFRVTGQDFRRGRRQSAPG